VSAEIKSLFLNGPGGRLEALLHSGAADAKRAALVCHPHPLHGGTMHNKVVFHAMKALHSFGYPALRFNFRGAGLSEGEHDHGRGEVEDVRAALAWLAEEFKLPVIFAGFSFGAATGLRACADDARVMALISLGTPVQVDGRLYSYGFLRTSTKPKLFLSGAQDPYSPQDAMRDMVETLQPPKKLSFIEGAGHFFESRLDEMRVALEDWVRGL